MTDPTIDDMTSDILRRMDFGMRHYGVPLLPHNGRNPYLDAYEEGMDLCLYLRQALAEKWTPRGEPSPEVGLLVIDDLKHGWEPSNLLDATETAYGAALIQLRRLRVLLSASLRVSSTSSMS